MNYHFLSLGQVSLLLLINNWHKLKSSLLSLDHLEKCCVYEMFCLMSTGIWQVLLKISLVPNHTYGNLIAYPAHIMVGNTCLQLEQLWMQLPWWMHRGVSSLVAVEKQEHLQSRVGRNIESIDRANSQHLHSLLGRCSAILGVGIVPKNWNPCLNHAPLLPWFVIIRHLWDIRRWESSVNIEADGKPRKLYCALGRSQYKCIASKSGRT